MEKKASTWPEKNLEQAYRVAYLVAGFIRKDLTEAERDELDDWILASEDNMRLFEELTDEENLASSLAWFEDMELEQKLEASKEPIRFKGRPSSLWIWGYAAAAAILLAAGVWWMYFRQADPAKPLVTELKSREDISPGFNQAILVMEDGKQLALQQGRGDTLITPSLRVNRAAGELVYGAAERGERVSHHLLLVPQKGSYKAVLPDGTRVWLNAESSLRYPTAFTGKERLVQLTGEAYFEVAKNKALPFRVLVNDMEVEVLGTSFNISAYANDHSSKTALVEGVVKISAGGGGQLLKPGQMASWSGRKIVLSEFDVEEVLDWKDNLFVFRDAPLEEVMRKLARWYGVEVEYREKINFHLNATIKREVPVSKLIGLLESTGHAHFSIEQNRIVISK